jgi:hypothetical protein
MEFFLTNLINVCVLLSKKVEKCSFHVNQIQDQVYFAKLGLLNNYFWFCLLIFFFILISIILYLKKKITYRVEVFFILFNFFLILLTILLFKNNIPFTDTWYELDFLINSSQKTYLLTKFDNFLFGFRPIHLLIFNYFNLNYDLIIYLNIFIFYLSAFILILLIDKSNAKKFMLLFLLILFSGKWFNIFYEPVNIVWTINFLLTLCFCYLLLFKKNLIINISIIIILFLSIINFKASFVTIMFSIFYGLFVEKKIRDKLVFILSPIFLLLIVNHFLEINTVRIIDKNIFNPINYIPNTNILLILKNFISMQSIVFFPYIKYSVNASFFFSLFQNLLIIFYLLKNQNLMNNFNNFIKNNPIMIIGILGCFTTSLVKQDIIQIRYFSFSLLYQIGFMLFIINNYNFLNNLKKFLLFRNFLLITFFLNLIFFHQGIHFALSKFTVYAKSLECLKINDDDKLCESYIYEKTFYNDKNFDKEKFNNIIIFLKKNNLTFFRNL